MNSEGATGILFVRGVGTAAADESLRAASAGISKRFKHPIEQEELNWSWGPIVQWPFSPKSLSLGRLIPFLSILGPSTMKMALAGIPAPSSRWEAAIAAIACPLMRIAVCSPILLLAAFTAGLTGLWKVASVFLVIWLLFIFMPAFIGFCCGVTNIGRSLLRCAAISFLWPLVFLAVIGSSSFVIPVAMLLYALPLIVTSRVTTPIQLLEEIGQAGSSVYEPNPSLLQWLVGVPMTLLVGGIALRIALGGASFYLRRYQNIALPILKVLADIARYLGDDEYRMNLQSQFVDQINRWTDKGCRRVFVFSHSLGTVISVDSLLSPRLRPPAELFLVTGGSPLRRIFHTCFPSRYSSPVRIRSLIVNRFECQAATFRWVHVYRPGDPIGGSLGLAEHERSTDTRLGWMKAHSDYWSDQEVHAKVEELICVSAKSVRGKDEAATNLQEVSLQVPIKTMAFVGWWIVVVAVALLPAWWIFRPMLSVHDLAKEVSQRGLTVNATMERYWIVARVPTNAYDNLGRPVKIPKMSIRFDAMGQSYRLPPSRILVDRRSLARMPRQGQRMSREVRVPVDLAMVQVRFLPETPQRFTIVGHERRGFSLVEWLLAVGVALALGLVAFISCVILWSRGLSSLISAFIGADTAIAWRQMEDWSKGDLSVKLYFAMWLWLLAMNLVLVIMAHA